MKHLFLIVCVLAGYIPRCPAAEVDVRAVFVKDSEIFVMESDGTASQLTRDGLPKSLPVWSKDGSFIAFVRSPRGRTLADLIIVSADGSVHHEIPFREMDGQTVGMRFVESLGWLSKHRLIVSGSLNPSTVEHAIVDIGNGAVVQDYMTDGFLFAVSPDGNHVAYASPIPHFMSPEDRRPQLCFDDECKFDHPQRGYPGTQAHIEFLSSLVWSPDSSAVAVVVEDDPAVNGKSVLVRSVRRRVQHYQVPVEATDGMRVDWSGKQLFLSAHEQYWQLTTEKNSFVPVRPSPTMLPAMLQGLQFRTAEARRFYQTGLKDLDLWCTSCALNQLPRRNGPQ